MAKDVSEKKSKKEKRKSEVATLPVDGVLIEKQQDEDGDITMEATVVEVVSKDKKKKDKSKVLSPIAHPLATDKLTKKVYKTTKKAAKRSQVKRGVKEVMKGIRKGNKGLLIIAGDISPMDIISPLPVLAEDNGIPYIFVTSKEELAKACLTKRPTSCVLIVPTMPVKKLKRASEEDGAEKDDDYSEMYEEVVKEVKDLDEKDAIRMIEVFSPPARLSLRIALLYSDVVFLWGGGLARPPRDTVDIRGGDLSARPNDDFAAEKRSSPRLGPPPEAKRRISTAEDGV
ncbi:snoRNA-binding protein [Tulasnella sp. 427]|nr:snoRNA-binding protein [Tulasnella sp. 427]